MNQMCLPAASSPLHHHAPLVSVVIPTYDRPKILAAILDVLAAQIEALPPKAGNAVEVIVVDNDSAASAREVTELAMRASPALSYVLAPMQGVVHARNAGLGAACGTYVIFLDDDEIPAPAWLDSWLDLAAGGQIDAAFGRIVPRYETEPSANRSILDRMFSRAFDAPVGADITRYLARLGTGNSMFRRARLQGENTFDTRFNRAGGEDLHMIGQLTRSGARLIWNGEAGVEEVVPAARMTLDYLKKRRFNQAQLRCLLVLRGGGTWVWPRLALWMGVGLIQVVVNRGRYLLALVTGRSEREAFGIEVQGGLGKIFWCRDTTLRLYQKG